MTKFLIKKHNGQEIPCIADIPENCKKIVIIIHGFSSSKESDNATFMMKYFGKRGLGTIAYDQPGHGTAEASGEKLLLKNCLDSLKAVEEYLREHYPDAEICYFGSSFGGYILGMYIARGLNSGSKAFMRCAAVNFPQLILGDDTSKPDEKAVKTLEKQGYMDAMVDGELVRLYLEFLEELKANSMVDMYNQRKPQNVKFCFVHGGDDPVVPVQGVKEFANKHGYPITIVAGENHPINISPESPTKVGEIAYRFYLEN